MRIKVLIKVSMSHNISVNNYNERYRTFYGTFCPITPDRSDKNNDMGQVNGQSVQ